MHRYYKCAFAGRDRAITLQPSTRSVQVDGVDTPVAGRVVVWVVDNARDERRRKCTSVFLELEDARALAVDLINLASTLDGPAQTNGAA